MRDRSSKEARRGTLSNLQKLGDERERDGCAFLARDLPRELLQAIGRCVPAHQRGVTRLVCRSWCEAISQDVAQLQLPLAALAPLPAWQTSLMGPGSAPAAGSVGATSASPREAALRRLFARFPDARHLVLLHNTVLPPPVVQTALSSLRVLCPNVRHVEVRDSVSWEQPAELAPLVLAEPGPAAAPSGAAVTSAASTPAAVAAAATAAGTAAAATVGASRALLRELTVTYLASPDMMRVARRWFGRELERLVTPDWSVERLRVRWLMGEAPRSFFTSRGFTRWTNAMLETAPDRLGLVKHLEFAWAELSDGSFDRAPTSGAGIEPALALAPPLPPWMPEPYHAALPLPLPPPPPPPPPPAGQQQPPLAGMNPAAAAAALIAVGHVGHAASVFQAAIDGQLAEEEVGPMDRLQGDEDRWNHLGTLSASATAALGLRGISSSGGNAAGGEAAAGTGPRQLRPGLPLALCAFTNLKTLTLCCMASQAPADHVLRLLLRCRRLEKLSLVHHEAYASWPVRRVQKDLMQALEAVVREELGGDFSLSADGQAAAGSQAPSDAAAAAPPSRPPFSNPATLRPRKLAAGSAARAGRSGWWPSHLTLQLRELQLPATPALLALLHLPRPALARLEVLDLQVIMAQGYMGPMGPSDQALAGTARLAAALRAARASGARLRDLFLNNVDLSPHLLETITEIDSLEQLLVFSGVLVLKDCDEEPGRNGEDDEDGDEDDSGSEDVGDGDDDGDPPAMGGLLGDGLGLALLAEIMEDGGGDFVGELAGPGHHLHHPWADPGVVGDDDDEWLLPATMQEDGHAAGDGGSMAGAAGVGVASAAAGTSASGAIATGSASVAEPNVQFPTNFIPAEAYANRTHAKGVQANIADSAMAGQGAAGEGAAAARAAVAAQGSGSDGDPQTTPGGEPSGTAGFIPAPPNVEDGAQAAPGVSRQARIDAADAAAQRNAVLTQRWPVTGGARAADGAVAAGQGAGSGGRGDGTNGSQGSGTTGDGTGGSGAARTHLVLGLTSTSAPGAQLRAKTAALAAKRRAAAQGSAVAWGDDGGDDGDGSNGRHGGSSGAGGSGVQHFAAAWDAPHPGRRSSLGQGLEAETMAGLKAGTPEPVSWSPGKASRLADGTNATPTQLSPYPSPAQRRQEQPPWAHIAGQSGAGTSGEPCVTDPGGQSEDGGVGKPTGGSQHNCHQVPRGHGNAPGTSSDGQATALAAVLGPIRGAAGAPGTQTATVGGAGGVVGGAAAAALDSEGPTAAAAAGALADSDSARRAVAQVILSQHDRLGATTLMYIRRLAAYLNFVAVGFGASAGSNTRSMSHTLPSVGFPPFEFPLPGGDGNSASSGGGGLLKDPLPQRLTIRLERLVITSLLFCRSTFAILREQVPRGPSMGYRGAPSSSIAGALTTDAEPGRDPALQQGGFDVDDIPAVAAAAGAAATAVAAGAAGSEAGAVPLNLSLRGVAMAAAEAAVAAALAAAAASAPTDAVLGGTTATGANISGAAADITAAAGSSAVAPTRQPLCRSYEEWMKKDLLACVKAYMCSMCNDHKVADGRDAGDEAILLTHLCSRLAAVSDALRSQLARLEAEGSAAALSTLRSGALRDSRQEEELVEVLQCWAQMAEALDATLFAADVASRMLGDGPAATAATSAGGTSGSATVFCAERAAAAAAAATTADPEAAVAALRAARPACRLRCAADEGMLLMLRLDGLTRLTRLRRLCLDFSPDNSVPLPVASTVRALLRGLPSLESLHVTDQFPYPENQPLGYLALPAVTGVGAAATAAGRISLYDSTLADGGSGANQLTSLTLAARQPRRVWRAHAADSAGMLLAPTPSGNEAAAAAAPNMMALLAPLERTALSGTLCSCDIQTHWGTLPRFLRALCLHRVQLLSDLDVPTQPENAAQRLAYGSIAAAHVADCGSAAPAASPQLAVPFQRPPAVPPLLQHLWLSNVTLSYPMDFGGLLRELLALASVSGGLQTLVVRHCFVVRPLDAGGGGGAATPAKALRLISSALATLDAVGNGGHSGVPRRMPHLLGRVVRCRTLVGSVIEGAAHTAMKTHSSVLSITGEWRASPQRLVLSEEDLALLCEMQSLRTLALDSCLRMEDVGRLAALTCLRTLALNPNVVASEEARARLDMEMASRFSPSLQAAVMRLAPLQDLRGLWLPEWAASRSQLLLWQSQLAALGPALVTLRVMDQDNLWRLPTPAGCPDVDDSLQWWLAEVWNTI